METKQLTAVELLEIELKNWLEDAICLPDYIFEQAKQMEKEQIMMAYNDGRVNQGLKQNKNSEQYYEQTYGNIQGA